MMPNDVESVISIEQDDVSRSWRHGRFEDELSHPASRYIVLDRAPTVVAFGGLWLGFDEVHIVTMAVRASERRSGYGGLVLRGLLAVAADLEMATATLECRVSNHGARALYKKFGFVEVGERRAYYSNGEHAVIMTTEDFDEPSFQARLRGLDAELGERFPAVVVMPAGQAPARREGD